MSIGSTAYSHSFVVSESPIANSEIDTPPTEISITFNNEVEENFSLKLINEQQQVIVSESAHISKDQKQISIQIPTLENGAYQVEYYVISSRDGHPMQGSYSFLVNAPSLPISPDDLQGEVIVPKPTVPNNEQSQIKTDVNELQTTLISEPSQSTQKVSLSEIFIYIMKTIYYFGLLLFTGWVMGWQIVRSYSFEVRKKYLLYGMVFQILHLIGLTSAILIQLNIFTVHGVSLSFNFPIETKFGLLWFLSLLISLLGFLILFKNSWIDMFMILAIVISKSLNGHAAEFDPVLFLVISDSIHLIAASFWVAGIVYILLFWRKQRLYVKSFLPIFSAYVPACFVLLMISGSFMTLNFIPDFDSFQSTWGIVLLIKIFLVCIVVYIGNKIRLNMKNSNTANLGKWIKLDFLFMCIIVIIVSVLTYLNPLP